MIIINKRQLIKDVAKRWREQYGFNKIEIYDTLKKLDLNKCSEEEVTKVIGNSTWTDLYCNECEKKQDKVIKFLEKNDEEYEANSCNVCLSCLKKAIDIMESAK